MKKFVTILLTTMVILSTSVASAAQLKIGVVDVHQILQKSPEVASINKKLKTQFQPREEKIARAQKHLQSQAEKLERDGAVMSTSDRQKLAADVAKSRRSLYRLQQDFHDDLTVAERQATQKLMSRVQAAINKIAKADHYDLILQRSGTPFASNSIDVTQKVLKTLHKS